MKQNMDNKWIIGLLLVAILAIGGYLVIADNNTPVVSAEGMGSVKAMPDQTVVNVNVMTRERNASDASSKNSKITNDIVAALKKAGIDEKDIQSNGFSSQPEYSYENGKQEYTGYYVVNNNLVVKLSNFSKTSEVVDIVFANGGAVSWIDFSLSTEKQNEYKAQALKQATEDATNKASAIAEGAGKRLGKLVSIGTSEYNYYPMRAYDSYSAGAELKDVQYAVSNIAPMDQEVTANVRVSYKIK